MLIIKPYNSINTHIGLNLIVHADKPALYGINPIK